MMEAMFPRSNPEGLHIDPRGIEAFVHSVEAAGLKLHSCMLVRRGYVAAEQWWPPQQAEEPHALFSLSKSFCSTAVGMAVGEGLLSVEDAVICFFPEYITPEIERNGQDLQIRHLLTLTVGHGQDPSPDIRGGTEEDWVKAFLEVPIVHPPGSRFLYSSIATYMVSAILQKVTGMTLLDYLRPRLFDPLGIDQAVWEACPRGISTGGWGLHLRTEDVAKFGQLYLQNGNWNGQSLVSEEWIREATSVHISTEGQAGGIDKQQGYGYQFWRCRFGGYCARGMSGQFCIILPEQEAVLVITSDESNMQGILDVVWEHLLPAIQ